MKLARHELALERLVNGNRAVRETFGVSMCILEKTTCVSHHPINADKVFGFLSPDGKLHITHRDTIVTHPQLVLITVDEHLRQVIELWDQLLAGMTGKKTSI